MLMAKRAKRAAAGAASPGADQEGSAFALPFSTRHAFDTPPGPGAAPASAEDIWAAPALGSAARGAGGLAVVLEDRRASGGGGGSPPPAERAPRSSSGSLPRPPSLTSLLKQPSGGSDRGRRTPDSTKTRRISFSNGTGADAGGFLPSAAQARASLTVCVPPVGGPRARILRPDWVALCSLPPRGGPACRGRTTGARSTRRPRSR